MRYFIQAVHLLLLLIFLLALPLLWANPQTQVKINTPSLYLEDGSITPQQINKSSIQVADTWGWPLGNDGYIYTPLKNSKYGVVAENTEYAIRNLDLILGSDNNITCFGVGAHHIYHAGVDLYRIGESTAGAEVKVVANGVVIDKRDRWPGTVILIEHILPNNARVYSLYAHLENVPWNVRDTITKGEVLGIVSPQPHTGRFSEFHPDGDDSHLHFEIRTFLDGASVFPECASTGVFGPGYTYPNLPAIYGYRDPLDFIQSRLTLTHSTYIPMVLNGQAEAIPTCQEGQNLLQNTGFEGGSIEDPTPWLEVSTAFDLNPLHHRVQEILVFNQKRSIRFGGWDITGRSIDEEVLQGIIIPSGTISVTWGQVIQIINQVTPDPKDYFTLTLIDAETGLDMLSGGGVRLDGNDRYADGWYSFSININGFAELAGRSISLSYSGFSQDDFATHLIADDVSLITHCGQAQKQNQGDTNKPLPWNLKVKPIP